MKKIVLILLVLGLVLDGQVVFGQGNRNRNRDPNWAGSAAPGTGGGRGRNYEDDYTPPPPPKPQFVTQVPSLVVPSRTPSERNFQPMSEAFSAPQVVLDPETFSGAEIASLAFSPDGRYLAAAGDVVRIWSLQTQQLVHTLRGQREYGGAGGCTSVVYSPDGRQLLVAVAGYNASLRVYDTTDFSEIQEVFGGHDGHISGLAFSRDGRYLATAGVDNFVHIWDWPNRKKTRSYSMNAPVMHLSFPSAGDDVLAITSGSKTWNLYYWSLGTGEMPDEPRRRTLHQMFHNAPVVRAGNAHLHACAIRCDEGYAVFGLHDPKATGRNMYRCAVWRGGTTGSCPEHGHRYFVTACAINPKRGLVASGDALGNISVWSATTGAVQAEFKSPASGIYSVQFDGPTRLKFGRKPYTPATGWRLNHYAPLTEYIDLASWKVGRVGEGGVSETPLVIADRLDDRRLQLDSGQVLSVRRGQQLVASIPYGRSSVYRPLAYGFLQGNDLGFAESVFVGFNNGVVTAYEPGNMLLKRDFRGHTGQIWSVSQSPDRRLMATASGDNTIRVWSLKEGRSLGNLPVYTENDGTIYHVVPGTPAARTLRVGDRLLKMDGRPFSDLGDLLSATGSWPYQPGQRLVVEYQSAGHARQATIELSDMGDIVEPLLNIKVEADGRDWIAWTPRGYYAASAGGDRLIGWQENQGRDRAARFHYADQFRNDFYRPDIVALSLETADLDQAVQLANNDIVRPPAPLDVREDMASLRPPTVRILAPPTNAKVTSPDVTVRAEITVFNDAPIQEVTVIVNGRTYHDRNIVLDAGPGGNQDGKRTIFEKRVRLSPGENRISVSATAASIGRSGEIWVNCDRPKDAAELYAVAIGISAYAHDAIPKLQSAADDAVTFIEAMQQQKQRGHFAAVHPRLLINEQARRADAEAAISWLLKNAKEEDVVAVFLSGHGLLDGNQNYYLATHDADPDEPFLTCLNWRMIEHLVQNVRCHVLLFIDTCHAGGALGGRRMQFDSYRNLSTVELGAFVFAAAGPNDPAIETESSGIFTRALIETLNDSASDNPPADGLLSYLELSTGLDTRVKAYSGQQQEPYIKKPPSVGNNPNLFRLPTGR